MKKHLPDAVIIEMLLLMSFEYPKNKVLFFSVCYHQVPNVSQLTDLTLSKSLMRVPNVSVLTCSYLVSGTRYQNSAFLQLIFLPFLITFQKIIHFGELFFSGTQRVKICIKRMQCCKLGFWPLTPKISIAQKDHKMKIIDNYNI